MNPHSDPDDAADLTRPAITPSGPATGWYGKLPSLGDFASRRLDPTLLEAWDGWLAGGIAGWRQREPDRWLPAYLAGPSWRFIALPGAIPGCAALQAHAGVLLPSVDRVGRYFPFTLLWPLHALPNQPGGIDRLLRRLHALDDLAVDALQEDWPVDQLESELARLEAQATMGGAAAPCSLPPAPGPQGALELTPPADLATALGGWAVQALCERFEGCVLWLSDPGTGQTRLRITQGLPEDEAFAELLGDPGAVATRIEPE